MSQTNMKNWNVVKRFLAVAVAAGALLLPGEARAAAPGIQGTAFQLTAAPTYITQPDGTLIYSWGYGCATTFKPTFAPAQFNTGVGFCPTAQIPGPTLIVTEGQTFTVQLTNNLPTGAGNTSILFPNLQLVSASGGTKGLLTQEATPTSPVTYTLKAQSPGTRAYYSGSQTDLQVEMGLYGAVIVLPNTVPAGCTALNNEVGGREDYRLWPSAYDHAASCYDREYLFQWMELDPKIHRQAEQQAQAVAGCSATTNPTPSLPCPTTLAVPTEPYHPNYYLINGRSMPDDMDADYAPNYPAQPYNGNPHMRPGELILVRTIGQGRWMHPFHQHGNHVRILARDANLILSQNDPSASATVLPRLGGRMEFTTDTYPGQSYDGIFYWSGKGLGWDIYGHTPPKAVASIASAVPTTTNGTTVVTVWLSTLAPPQLMTGAQVTISGINANPTTNAGQSATSGLPTAYDGTFTVTSVTTTTGTNGVPVTRFTYTDNAAAGLQTFNPTAGVSTFWGLGPKGPSATASIPLPDPIACTPNADGYDTSAAALARGTYYEWCADHNHPLETNPAGQVGAGGPATLFDPLIVTNGLWFNGTPYLGPDAVMRSRGPTPLPPGTALQNPPNESGIAFMWHSHNEREITTNNIFPGGMMMMMLVDSREFVIDETK